MAGPRIGPVGYLSPIGSQCRVGDADPDNRWLGRAPVKRLELEQWRDAMLQVSGRLDTRAGGPSDNLNDPNGNRRTVYGKVSRSPRARYSPAIRSTRPQGPRREARADHDAVATALLFEQPFVRNAAESVAAKVVAAKGDTARSLYRRVLGRDPNAEEIRIATQLATAGTKPDWALVAQALLASNEFLYLN